MIDLPDRSDVAILGAGPAGAALAVALRRAGVAKVTLLDRPARGAFRIGESVAPGIAPLLRRLGLPDDLGRYGHSPYHGNRSLWGGVAAVDDFLHRGLGHGWHLDRAKFDAWLRDAAVCAGAQLLTPARLEAVTRGRNGWDLRIRHNVRTIDHTATLIVDASGRRAALGAQLGVTRRRCDTLVAVATVVPDAASGLGTLSLVEAAPEGWWYAAALPNGTALVSLMTDHDLARAAGWRCPATFAAAWAATDALARRVPPLSIPGGLSIFPAHTQFVECAAGPGWLSVGDALLALDPLTSAGITGAIEDACAAAETICTWLGSTGPGERTAAADAYARRATHTLRRYLAERHRVYAAERRWTDRAFWQRRQTARFGMPMERGRMAALPGFVSNPVRGAGARDSACT